MSSTAVMVYVPLSVDRARRLRDTGALEGPLLAHAVTPGLLRAHDLAADAEDAEYTALAYAGVSALSTGEPAAGEQPLRLVVAAEVSDVPDAVDPADAFGRVSLLGLSWSSVSSLFADHPGSVERVALARAQGAGRSFVDVVDADEIETLLDESDLLWFAPSELDRLLDPGV